MSDKEFNNQGRAVRERDDLKVLLDRLELYITTAGYRELGTWDQSLLDSQAFHMRGYHDAVCKRIARFSLDA